MSMRGADLARLLIRATTWRSLDRRLDWSWAQDATGVPVKSKVGSPMDFSATDARLVCPDVTLTDALIQLTPRAPRPAGTSETGCGVAATPLGPEWVISDYSLQSKRTRVCQRHIAFSAPATHIWDCSTKLAASQVRTAIGPPELCFSTAAGLRPSPCGDAGADGESRRPCPGRFSAARRRKLAQAHPLLARCVSRRLKLRSITKCADMKCVSLERSPSQVNVEPHLAQNPRHLPGDELNLVICPSVTAYASRLKATKTETGGTTMLPTTFAMAPHHRFRLTAATKRSAPHRQLPSN